MITTIHNYNDAQTPIDKSICDHLASEISRQLPPDAEAKIWHAHPVWFLEGNPVVGYSRQKKGIRLMFWSGASFEEDKLQPGTGKFKDASIFYEKLEEIDHTDLQCWLEKAQKIQWDYKNLMKRHGMLVRLK